MYNNIIAVVDMEEQARIKSVDSEEPPRYGSLQSPSPPDEEYKVYPGRFYVLLVFTLLSVLQSSAWMTFGTIPNESYSSFGLMDDDITLIAGIDMNSCSPWECTGNI